MKLRSKCSIGARARRSLLVSAVVPLTAAVALLTAGPASAGTNSVTVQANTPTFASGVVVDGVTNSVVITASGTWQIGGPYGSAYGPEGSSNPFTEDCALVATAPMGALVGTLDGGNSWFAVGAGPTVVTGAGELGFAANDCVPGGHDFGYFGDNTGSVSVTITSTPRLPTVTSQCKNNGWRTYGVFKNQGDCVSYVATGGRNTPAG